MSLVSLPLPLFGKILIGALFPILLEGFKTFQVYNFINVSLIFLSYGVTEMLFKFNKYKTLRVMSRTIISRSLLLVVRYGVLLTIFQVTPQVRQGNTEALVALQLELKDLRQQHEQLQVSKLSRVMRKPTFWFPTWSNTNQAVQLQKMARGLKFAKLICVFVFAYAKCCIFHDEAQLCFISRNKFDYSSIKSCIQQWSSLKS